MGEGDSGAGGYVSVTAGSTSDSRAGGGVSILSGKSSKTSSGSVHIGTPDAGLAGVSGDISLSIGISSEKESGSLIFVTGAAEGAGGDIVMHVGSGKGTEGGDVLVTAGESSTAEGRGGNVIVIAGEGSSTDRYNGGDGGNIIMKGGRGSGGSSADRGGDIGISGGDSYSGQGGDIQIRTGHGERTSSGMLDISTAPSGLQGTSGSIALYTGTATQGDSGSVSIQTGSADQGKGGFYHVFVGTSGSGDGGKISMVAGDTTSSDNSIGGSVEIQSGRSYSSDSGALKLSTADAGWLGSSGAIELQTGSGARKPSGGINLSTGDSLGGAGGDIVLAVGNGDTGDGGNIAFAAGNSSAKGSKGGHVSIMGGVGTNTDKSAPIGGGNGGSVFVGGGGSNGMHPTLNAGGNVEVTAGSAAAGRGGSVVLQSGSSSLGSSGKVFISSADAGVAGMSGEVVLSTGHSTKGSSGSFFVGTGDALQGPAGNVDIVVGDGNSGHGGHLSLVAGDTSAEGKAGGNITIQAGGGSNIGTSRRSGGSGGGITIEAGIASGLGSADIGGGVNITAGAASGGRGGSVQVSTGVSQGLSSGSLTLSSAEGVLKSGNVALKSGPSKAGVSGSISIGTGHATSGSGGSVNITVGAGNIGEGGEINVVAGNTSSKYGGDGGDVRITTGSSEFGTSGAATLSAAGAPEKSDGANSGPVRISSGSARSGTSGDVNISTGSSSRAGNIFMLAGNSTLAEGSTISVSAGSAEQSIGGSLYLVAGSSFAKFPGGDVELSAGNSSRSEGGAIRVIGGFGGGDTIDSVGGNVIVSGGNSVAEGAAGGSVILSPGSSADNLTGSVSVHSANGENRLHVSNDSVTLTSGEHGGLYLKAQLSPDSTSSRIHGSSANMIGFSVSSNPQSTNDTYDLRLLDLGDDDTRLVASVPMQVTSVQYSSDKRIKERIVDIDEDDLLQHFRRVELKEYSYTKKWRKVRNIGNDVRVRGVIANELREIFPEHVSIIPNFQLDDKDFELKNFLQVNKNALLLDFLAVFKALTNRYSVLPHHPLRSGDVIISSADAGDYASADNTGDRVGSTGDIVIKTGSAAERNAKGETGSIHLLTGNATGNVPGNIIFGVGSGENLLRGSSIELNPHNITLSAGISVDDKQVKGGSVNAAASPGMMNADGGDINITAGTSEQMSGGSAIIAAGAGNIGGNVTLSAGNGTTSGGSVLLRPGNATAKVGDIELCSPEGEVRLRADDDNVSIAAGDSGNLFFSIPPRPLDQEDKMMVDGGIIGFSIASVRQPSTNEKEVTTAYDFRLQDFGKGSNPHIVSTIPMQVTSVLHTSDNRIKTGISDVDLDDLLQRFQQIDYKEYKYTKEWREVMRLASDPTVRGVVAQQLAAIFPEHVQVIPEYSLPDKGLSMSNFHQIDQAGLTLDLVGALQAQHRRFSVGNNTKAFSGNVVVSSADGGFYFDASDRVSSSGNLTLQTGNSTVGRSSGGIYISSGSAVDGVAGDIELHAGSDGRSTHGSSITLSPLHASLVGGIGDGNSQPAGGNVGIVGGSSTMSAGGSITLEGGDSSTDARTSEKGGSVSVSAGDGYLGGDIVLTPGHGTKENNGVFEVKTPSGHRRILSSESDISISSGDEGGIFFTTNGTDRENNVVGFGMASPTSEDLLASDNGGYDFHLQSMGTDNPTVLSTAPMQVTSVHYAADSRIKEDVVDVDVDDILQRIQRIDYKEYAYTDDWKKVRRLSSDLRVRGIIAEQLATVFPEHVEIIDNYSLPDKGFGMRGFHQVDHTGLTLDLIGALQANYSHFLVTSNSPAQSGNVVVSSANRSSNEGPDAKYSASGNVTLMSGPAISASGSVEISTGHTSDGKAGRVDIAVGQGSLSSRASSLNLSALDVSLNGGTSNVPENGDLPGVTISILAGSATNDAANGGSIFAMTGAGPDTSGSATIKTHDLSSRNLNAESGSVSIASGSVENGQSGIVSLSTGSSMAGQAGKISITTGSSDSGSGASIFLIAGNSSEHGRPSGDVNVIGGNSFGYGSRGGMVNLHGGNGSETGGPVHISSGYSPWLSSGEILLDTANSGEVGNSGGISLKTGNAVEGETGTITLSSGSSASSASGAIHLSAGTAGKGNG